MKCLCCRLDQHIGEPLVEGMPVLYRTTTYRDGGTVRLTMKRFTGEIITLYVNLAFNSPTKNRLYLHEYPGNHGSVIVDDPILHDSLIDEIREVHPTLPGGILFCSDELDFTRPAKRAATGRSVVELAVDSLAKKIDADITRKYLHPEWAADSDAHLSKKDDAIQYVCQACNMQAEFSPNESQNGTRAYWHRINIGDEMPVYCGPMFPPAGPVIPPAKVP